VTVTVEVHTKIGLMHNLRAFSLKKARAMLFCVFVTLLFPSRLFALLFSNNIYQGENHA